MAEESREQKLARMRALYRGNPPATLLGSSATLGGTAREAPIESALTDRAATAPPGPNAFSGLRAGAELGASIAAGALPGGFIASRLVSGLGKLGAQIVGRGLPAGLAGMGASEWMTPDELETEADAMDRRQTAFGAGFAGEASGALVHPVLRKLMSPMRARIGPLEPSETVLPGAAEAQVLLRSKGATLTPREMRSDTLMSTAENIFEASILGQGPFQATHQRAEIAALQGFRESIKSFVGGVTPKQAGQLLGDALSGRVRIDKKFTRAAYKSLDSAITTSGGGAVVDLHPLLGKYTKEIGFAADAGDPYAKRILGMLRGGAPLTAIPGQPPQKVLTTFRRANAIRSYLLGLSRQTQGEALPDIRALAGKVASEVDTAIESGMQTLGPLGDDVVRLGKQARAASKMGHQTFDNEFIHELMTKSAPEDIAQALFEIDSPTRVRTLKQVLFAPRFAAEMGDPLPLWRKLQSSWMENLLSTAGEGEWSQISGKKLMGAIQNRAGSASELFSAKELKSLKVSAKALELSQGATRGTGSVAIQLVQAGAAGGLIGFGPGDFKDRAATAGVVILGPGALSLVFTSPRFSSFMLQRAFSKAERTGRGTSRVAAQAVSHLVADKIPFVFREYGGKETVYDPAQAVDPSQPNKPQSKF